MHSVGRSAFRTGVSATVFGGAALLGCNLLTGVDDYDFNGAPAGSSTSSGSTSRGSTSSGSTGSTGSSGSTGTVATVCPGGAGIPAANNPKCLPCLRENCCEAMTACAADATCKGERNCTDGCKDDDDACFVRCRNTFACGLPLNSALNRCLSEKCDVDCTETGSPAGVTDGGCTPGKFAGGPCVVTIPQCGCKVGENCSFAPGFGGDTTCAPAGTTANDHECKVDTDCVAGSTCISSACKPYCSTDYTCPATRGECRSVSRPSPECGGSLPLNGSNFCPSNCDPVNPSLICGPGVTCTPHASGTIDCEAPTGSGIGPSNCGTAAGLCAPGYVCLTISGTDTCSKWCRIGKTDCTAPATCLPFGTSLTAGGAEWGYCK